MFIRTRTRLLPFVGELRPVKVTKVPHCEIQSQRIGTRQSAESNCTLGFVSPSDWIADEIFHTTHADMWTQTLGLVPQFTLVMASGLSLVEGATSTLQAAHNTSTRPLPHLACSEGLFGGQIS